jgi:hypothetical protein
MMTADLTKKVVAWATEIAVYAAQLPSRQSRDSYLAERRHELVSAPWRKARGRAMRSSWQTPV